MTPGPSTCTTMHKHKVKRSIDKHNNLSGRADHEGTVGMCSCLAHLPGISTYMPHSSHWSVHEIPRRCVPTEAVRHVEPVIKFLQRVCHNVTMKRSPRVWKKGTSSKTEHWSRQADLVMLSMASVWRVDSCLTSIFSRLIPKQYSRRMRSSSRPSATIPPPARQPRTCTADTVGLIHVHAFQPLHEPAFGMQH